MTDSSSLPEFPSEYVFCLHDPLAGIYDFWTREEFSLQDIDSGSLIIPMRLDVAGGAFVLGDWSPPPRIDATLAENLATSLATSSRILEMLTGIYRRMVSHPAQMGFVPYRRDKKGREFGDWASASYPTKAIEQVSLNVPANLWDGSHAWFAPNSDPTAFGQFYLVSTADDDEVTWEIHQLGLEEEPLDYATWNDAEGLQRLWDYCITNNPEHMLAVQALENTTKIRNSRSKHLFALAVKEAREAFTRKKDQLRPRLTENAVSSAMAVTRPVDESGRATMRASLMLHSLAPYEVFGYRYQGSEIPTIYAGAEVVFYPLGSINRPTRAIDNPDFLERFLVALKERLDERKLGTICLATYGGETHVWVFKNPALAKANARALGIPDDVEWVEAEG